MKRVVIVHPEWGVLIGIGPDSGLAYFSLLDCAGQTACAVYSDEVEARKRVETWDAINNPDDYQYVTVEVRDEQAEALELLNAGIPKHMVEPMVIAEGERLREDGGTIQ